MTVKYTVLREFIYGWDFTLFGDNDQVVMTTMSDAINEVNDPEDNPDELMVARVCRKDKHIVAYSMIGDEVICKKLIEEKNQRSIWQR